MITVQEAEALILDNIGQLDSESIPLQQAVGRTLREPIVADRALPPFDRATLDGIALSSSAYNMGNRSFQVQGVIAAGSPPEDLQDQKACFEIMTGAPLPKGADCVLGIEEVDLEEGVAKLKDNLALSFGVGVHDAGSDCEAGATLLEPNVTLTAKEIAIAASVGKSEVLVSKSPRIIVVSTGDELVPIEQKPEVHEIRRSNDLTLSVALQLSGYRDVELLHLTDDPERCETELGSALERCDALVLAGGISKGKFDYIPETLIKLGVAIRFQRVSQRPGKPMWFGQFSQGRARMPVFALPGNPVSCFTCLRRYVIPALRKWSGLPAPKPLYAKLGHDITFKPDITLFLPVSADPRPSSELWVTPTLFNTSGDFVSVAKTDGFIELPRKRSIFPQGEAFRYFDWPQ